VSADATWRAERKAWREASAEVRILRSEKVEISGVSSGFHRSDGGAAGHNGPLEARFLMNGMLRSWDAIVDAWFRALFVGCRKFVINSGPFREKVVVFEVASLQASCAHR
jgi:hypothetical protein